MYVRLSSLTEQPCQAESLTYFGVLLHPSDRDFRLRGSVATLNVMNRQTFFTAALLAAIVGCGFVRPARSAEWQWSVPVRGVVSSETGEHPRAFLWIPPTCRQVRAVIVGQHNMLEEGVLEHPALRKALADLDFAAVWVSPAFDGNFRFDRGAGEHFQAMMADLAAESGYRELADAPVVPLGHSAMASYPYHFAAWKPSRTLAAISLKGTWPDFRDANSPPWKDDDLDGVPLLYIGGEYEDANGRAAKAADFRARNPRVPLTMLADAGGGHFDFHDKLVAYMALYLRKAAEARLPDKSPLTGPVTLKPIDPARQGWLVDRWRLDKPPRAAAAPVGQFTGDSRQAFWCFDEELARATENYGADQRGKRPQLLGYMQDGGLQNGVVVPQNPKLHAQVDLKFLPVGDGLTFKLAGVFLDTVPEGRPETWTGLRRGSTIGHASGGPIVISRICGPVEQLSADTFAIRFNRMGINNQKRSNEIWLMAEHAGDGQYKRAVQQAVMHFPQRNQEGAEQAIAFPPIPDQYVGVRTLELQASSSVGAEVRFYVREGPAEVHGNRLTFTPIPPRAKFPLKVTVVAWQWGRTTEPKLKTAEPKELSFLIRSNP